MHQDVCAIVTAVDQVIRTGGLDLAIAEFQRFVHGQPDDRATAVRLAGLFLREADAADVDGRCGDASLCLSVVANWRAARGDTTGAAELRARIDGLELADAEARLRSLRTQGSTDSMAHAVHARACVARGDAAAAAEHLTADMAEGDPSLLLTIAEIQLRGGRLDEGMALVERVLAADPSLANDVVELGLGLAARQGDAGFLLVDMAATVWAAGSQWQEGAAAFERFIALLPAYVPATVRLREIEAAAARAPDPSGVVLPFRVSRSA